MSYGSYLGRLAHDIRMGVCELKRADRQRQDQQSDAEKMHLIKEVYDFHIEQAFEQMHASLERRENANGEDDSHPGDVAE